MRKLLFFRNVSIAFLALLSMYACSESESMNTAYFIYVSHPRLQSNDSIYRPVYEIDFDKFDMTLLGGDLALSSFTNDTITSHLDSIFNFKSPNVLWSVGNHDYSSSAKWENTTQKKKYHAASSNDVTFITLDSQDSLSSIIGDQKDFLFTTLDSINKSSVIIMTHKLIYMNDHPVMDAMIATTCNANKGDCYHCHNDNNFYDVVYPKLLEVQNRGIQIIWVGGDLGYKTSEFEFIDERGIIFLGNGLWYPKNWNKVLIFTKEDRLPVNYEFVSLDSISKINEFSGK